MMSYARMAAIVFLASIVLILLERRRSVVSNFLSRKSTALNLTAVRIAVLAALLYEVHTQRILSFARLEPALLAPPKGWSMLAPLFPRSLPLVELLYAVFLISSAFALLGLFARFAMISTAVSSAYLLTIPQLFGKVDHYHHLLIFCVVLALYPSFDTLSLDALRKSWDAADGGTLEGPVESRVYAEGLNAILILMALMYFFPGTWKIAGAWPHWFTSRNMAYLLYKRMLEISPSSVRLTVLRMPFPLLVSTYAAVLVELGMVFMILWRQSRRVALILGLAFHNLTNLLMAIPFVALQFCYAALVDWTAFFRFVAIKRGLLPITVVYDPYCKLCRRTIATLCNLDWIGNLNLLPNTRLAELREADAIASIDGATGMTFAAVDEDGHAALGYEAYQLIASRIVLFWPIELMMRIGFVSHLGRAVYEKIASSRTCDPFSRTPEPYIRDIADGTFPGARPFACACVAAMILFGMARIVNAWPLACYPTFASPASTAISKLTVQTIDSNGAHSSYTLSYDCGMEDLLGAGRWNGLTQQQMNGKAFSKPSAAALIRLWRTTHGFDRMSSATLSIETFDLDLDTLILKPIRTNRFETLYAGDGI